MMNKLKKIPNRIVPLLILIVTCVSFAGCSSYQEYVADAIEQEAEDRLKSNTDQAIDAGFDKAESGIKNAVKCAVGDQACIDKAKAQGKPVVVTDETGKVVKQIPANDAKGKQGMGKINTNYDFKPGERTLFAADFSDAVVGNFPRSLEFRGGTISIVSYQGGRALRIKTNGAFDIHLSEVLPKRFTLSFNVNLMEFVNGMEVRIVNAKGKPVGTHFIQVDTYDGIGVESYKRSGISSLQGLDIAHNKMVPIRVMADGSYVKVYVGKRRVANIPNAKLGRSRTIRFAFVDVRENPIYLGDIRIAAGGRDLYSTLEAEGRVAMQGIHFATGSANITPESAQTIEKIANLLKTHSDLKLLIEGHTSSSGSYEANMQLSKERAAAVKTSLVEDYEISPDRLKTNGLGETQPTASNDTEEGRAKNRRVEIVKL